MLINGRDSCVGTTTPKYPITHTESADIWSAENRWSDDRTSSAVVHQSTMNMSEELQRLDSPDLALSQRMAQRLISALNVSRDPELLNDLMDYHLQKHSKAALRVIITLKDIHSQVLAARWTCHLIIHVSLPPILLCLFTPLGFLCQATRLSTEGTHATEVSITASPHAKWTG